MNWLSELEDGLMTTGWKSRFGGREWQVSQHGLRSRAGADGMVTVHRTRGHPRTVERYLEHWGDVVKRVAAEERVPLDIVLATLAAENGPARLGRDGVVVLPPRKEPGYISDEETPHLISVGPAHVLITTARAAMGDPTIDRAWLEVLENNLRASFRALIDKDRRWGHGMDPILAAACYNSGGVHDASNPRSRFHNRWHLRCWVHTDGKSHLDTFANWYGDARFVLSNEAPGGDTGGEDGEEADEDPGGGQLPLNLPTPRVPRTWFEKFGGWFRRLSF